MKRFMLAVATVALLVGLFALGKHVLWPDQVVNDIPKNLDVDLSLEGVTLSQGRDGKKLWSLHAKGANYAEDKDDLTLAAPVITYWGDDDIPIQAMSPHGQVWQKEDKARMWGGVNVTRDTYKMRSETLDYLGPERKFVLSGNVELHGQTIQARSNVMTYLLESGDVVATGDVQVTLN